MPLEYIDRPPRMQPELPTGKVKIPKPPEKPGLSLQTLIALIIPLITVLGFVFASGSGNMTMALIMGVAMGASVVFGVISLRAERKAAAEKEHAYKARLAEMRQGGLGGPNPHRTVFHSNYPE